VATPLAGENEADLLAALLEELPPEAPPVPLPRQAAVSALGFVPLAAGRPFLIYGQGRTGSTLLGDLLAAHPQVFFGNEVLAGHVRAPRRYLEGLRRRHAQTCYGVHVKPYHLTVSQRVTDRRRWLSQLAGAGWMIVHLQRENTLRHVLSNVTFNQGGTSHFRLGDGRTTERARVDVPDLLRHMRARAALARQEREEVEGLAELSVSYERDLASGPEGWSRVTDVVFRGLQLPHHPVSTELRRINTGTLPEIVANYDEMADALSRTEWAHLLD
jgi:LPS sulfotransferase NodH